MPQGPIIIEFSDVDFDRAASALFSEPGFACIDARNAPPTLGRYSLLTANPVHTFSMAGAFITVDGHTTIDTPHAAFARFSSKIAAWPSDPYLPFSCGLIGYIGFEAARALGGGEPAAGFSRHPQCKAGIYESVVLFDHAEGTSWAVANGADLESAREGAIQLLGRIRSEKPSTPARKSATPSGVRMTPEELHFRETLEAAHSWINADADTRLHLVRHASTPLAETHPLSLFLSNRASTGVRALFTHEGSSFEFSSHDILMDLKGSALSSTIPAERLRGKDRARGVPALREFSASLESICEHKRLARHGATAEKSFIRFTGKLDRNLSALDAVIAMLPAHTATGTPYERALRFIDMRETSHRSFYGGAFGTMDAMTCRFRTIETMKAYADGNINTTAGVDLEGGFDVEETLLRFNEVFTHL